MNTKFYLVAKKNLEYIKSNITDDKYLNNLLYANIITILETYLYNLFVFLLHNDFKLLKKLTTSSKFKNQKIPLKLALTNIEKYIIEMIKGLNYHNLSDIEPLFREVLDIKIDYNEKIIETIDIRHNIIHRNGYDKDGKIVNISKEEFLKTINLFSIFILEIDKQIIKKYNVKD